MKVLTIKEPFASLISLNIKHYETRSWRTNYRGKIYIHCSKSISNINDRPKLKDIIKENNIEFKPSYIICEANLDDCIYMDKNFINSVSSTEKIVGLFEEGRYAWKLSNIKLITPVEAKGKLGIWNYDFDINYLENND